MPETELAKVFNSLDRGFKNIFGDESSTVNQSFKLFKFGFSLLFGLQIAFITSILLGTARVTTEAVKIANTKIIKNMLGTTSLLPDAALTEFSNKLGEMITTTWMELGIHAPLKIAEKIQGVTENFLDETGLGTTNKALLKTMAGRLNESTTSVLESMGQIDKKVFAEEIKKGATNQEIDEYLKRVEEISKVAGVVPPSSSPSKPKAEIMNTNPAPSAPPLDTDPNTLPVDTAPSAPPASPAMLAKHQPQSGRSR